MDGSDTSGKVLTEFSLLQELAEGAADKVVKIASESIATRGVFTIALAGGSTPKGLYTLLASEEYKTKTDWSKWRVYFGDERMVALSDDRSNYKMANDTLLKHVPISPGHIYIPPVSLANAGEVATAYEQTLRESFAGEALPRFDLILLGLGSDGHTASLFPDKAALEENERLVVETGPGVLPPPVPRITFTLPVINTARHVLFLASGSDKADAFSAAYYDQAGPAGLVEPTNGRLEWLVTDDLIV